MKQTNFSDDTLLTRLRQGEAEAFSLLYDRYWSALYRAAYNRLRDRAQSQDVVQNIFTTLWDRRAQQAIRDLPAYLHQSVKFQVLRREELAGRTQFLATFEDLITEPVESSDPVMEREVLQLLRLFIDALPEKRRAIFIKRYHENYSTAEIAGQLGISQKTVQNQLNNAELALRMRLAHLMTLSAVAAIYLHHN